MKFTLAWLKEHLEFDLPLTELCTKLTSIGLEVESFVNPKEKLDNSNFPFAINFMREISNQSENIYHHLGTGGEISTLLVIQVSSFSF